MPAASTPGMRAARFRAARIALLLATSACATPDGAAPLPDAGGSGPAAAATPDTTYRQRPGYVVDSILPMEEELRRFRETVSDSPRVLTGGAPSRDALVHSFGRALARRDTAALERLRLTRAEFGHLVYPSSAYARPPYRSAPGLVWMQLAQNDAKGLTRLLRGHLDASRALDHRCDATPTVEGANRLWRGCRTRMLLATGDTIEGRFFGVIIERDGQFKFANYATDF